MKHGAYLSISAQYNRTLLAIIPTLELQGLEKYITK